MRSDRQEPAQVEVVLFTCDRGKYFPEALESVLGQTYRDFHVLIIDDASVDGTLELALEYERRLPERVTVVSKPERRDLGDSIILGLTHTKTAPYVAFHNDDDVWLPTKLEAQIANFRDHPALGMVATEAAIIDADGRITGKLFSDLVGKPDLVKPARRIFWTGNCFCAASVVASRAAIDLVELSYPLPGRCMDMYMWLVISSHMPIGWIDAPLTRYRVAPGQLTQTRSSAMWRETYALREHLLRTDGVVRLAVGGERAARERLDDNALYLARSYLRKLDLASYGWFSWQILKRRRLRLVALLAKCTGKALIEAGADRIRRRWSRIQANA